MNECISCGHGEVRELFPIEEHRLVLCPKCGLEKIDPQPTDETLEKIYGQHYYDAWGLNDFEELVANQKKSTFRHLLGKLGKPAPGAKLLDCGAATGFLMEAAAEMGYAPYGVELSEFGAESIAAKFGRDHVQQGQLENASFPGAPEGSFDVVTMCDFIEHVRDPVSVLAKARSLLSHGGRLVVTTPNRAGISRTLMGKKWSQYKLEHLYYFGPGNITLLLEKSGFGNVKTGPAHKKITLKYIFSYFKRYRHPLITPLAGAGDRILPEALKRRFLTLVLGDMLVIAEKQK